MNRLQALYDSKRMMPTDAAGLVRDGDTVVVPTGVGEPPALLHALSARRHELRDHAGAAQVGAGAGQHIGQVKQL